MITLLYRLVVTIVMSLFYNVLMGCIMLLHYVTHPFSDSSPKLRLQPPEALKNPRFGVHKYIKVNNIKMHYVESGDPTKELMIFVHGFPEFWYSWRHQIVEFQKNYWVVAIDMRGYGDSEKPENVSDYKVSILIEDLRDLIKCLGREKCVLVGHDWGALVSWAFRRRYPEMLKCLITFGGTSPDAFLQVLWNNFEQFRKSWYVFLFQGPWIPEMLLRFKDLSMFEAMRSEKSKQFITDEDIECYKYTFGKPAAFTSPLNYYRCNFIEPEDVPENKMSLPSLFVSGAKDDFLTAENGNIIKRLYSGTKVLHFEEFRHHMQQESPVIVNELIRSFLKENNL